MPDLNESVQVTVDDATVITVPLVTNLTATNAAPTAKTVGDALADKVDAEHIMENVTIKVNDVSSDNQGQILLDAGDIPVAEGSTSSIADALDTLNAKTAADITYETGTSIKTKIDAVDTVASAANAKTASDIVYTGTTTIKTKVDAVDAKTANDIIYENTTTIKNKIGAVESGLAEAVKYTQQTPTDSQKDQAAANLGVVSALEEPSASALTEAQQGYARANIGAAAKTALDAVTALMGSNYSSFISRDISTTLPIISASISRIASNSAWLYRFGRIAIVTFAFSVTSAINAGSALIGFPTSADGTVTYTPSGHIAGVMSRQWTTGSNNAVVVYRDNNVISSVGPVEAGEWRGFLVYGL